ncbi:MAG: sugar phosphate nucleotidyltransferase [Candidatus Sigynarchaeota archaeon]
MQFPLKIVCPIAGVGKRLQPFTFSKPKAFLKIAGKMIIDHTMEQLKAAFPRGTEMLFITGYKKELLVPHITKHYSDYFKLNFIEQLPRSYNEDIPIFPGLGHAICLARKCNFLQTSDTNNGLFIILSDRLPIEGFISFVEDIKTANVDGIIASSIVAHPEHYGVMQLDEKDFIRNIVEKPKTFISNIAISGMYAFNPIATKTLLDILSIMVEKPIPDDQEYQLTPALQNLVDQGFKIKQHPMKNEVLDIGRPSSLISGNKFFLSTQSTQTKCNAPDSHIVPPVHIGKSPSIQDSIIGPFVSLGDNVEIKNSIIRNSVIGDNVSLAQVITSDSIIGDNCYLEDIIKNSITVGDRSIISTKTNDQY